MTTEPNPNASPAIPSLTPPGAGQQGRVSVGRAVWLGALGFGAVSVVVYGTVAFGGRWLYRTLTESGAYTFWALVYLLGAPWLLARLLAPTSVRWRYGVSFVVGFLAYALGWVAAYFPLRNKPGEILASVVGPALFAIVMSVALRHPRVWPSTAVVMAFGHGLGYFAGDVFNTLLGGPVGMLMWGVCHGLGFGAAIGWSSVRWIWGGGGRAVVRASVGG